MEQKIREVIFLPIAEAAIENIGTHIAENGYPDTAEMYVNRLIRFANSLSSLSERYPICRHKYFAINNLRCAVFEKTYIFVYKILGNNLIIYNVIHGNRLQ